MLRYITNRVAGRRKSTNESLSVSEASELLGKLDSSIKGNIDYSAGRVGFALSDVALKDMVDFVVDKFSTSEDYYSDIEHQVYSGESGAKHYLELFRGKIEGRFGTEEIKRSPHRRATIDFFVQEK